MRLAPAGNLLALLQQVPDPRGRQGRRHSLEAMLASIVCAMLCGARGYQGIADWIHLQPRETWWALGFTRRPPTWGAFRHLLVLLPVEHFESVLRVWTEQLLQQLPTADDSELKAVAIDGKSLCGTLSAHSRAVHLLSLLDQQTGYVLSQRNVDHKTNEHKTAWPLLREMVLQGRVITGDSMFCQRDLCRKIVDNEGHYFFEVKDNQPSLKDDIKAEFDSAFSPRGSQPAA